jgi:hypothetical protein
MMLENNLNATFTFYADISIVVNRNLQMLCMLNSFEEFKVEEMLSS